MDHLEKEILVGELNTEILELKDLIPQPTIPRDDIFEVKVWEYW